MALASSGIYSQSEQRWEVLWLRIKLPQTTCRICTGYCSMAFVKERQQTLPRSILGITKHYYLQLPSNVSLLDC